MDNVENVGNMSNKKNPYFGRSPIVCINDTQYEISKCTDQAEELNKHLEKLCESDRNLPKIMLKINIHEFNKKLNKLSK
jgi:hypothetical protein